MSEYQPGYQPLYDWPPHSPTPDTLTPTPLFGFGDLPYLALGIGALLWWGLTLLDDQ
jgi:hypothetical protein